MKHQILSFLFVLSLGPASLGVPDPKPVMVFDVRRVPEIPEMIVREATLQGVPSHLAILVAYRESRFDPTAYNAGSRCSGLFQLAPHTVKVLRVQDPFDARQASIAGIGVLSWGLGLCKSEAGALQYYARGHCGNSKLEKEKSDGQ